MIRRQPRSTPLYSSAASDVYKRQVIWCVPDGDETCQLSTHVSGIAPVDSSQHHTCHEPRNKTTPAGQSKSEKQNKYRREHEFGTTAREIDDVCEEQQREARKNERAPTAATTPVIGGHIGEGKTAKLKNTTLRYVILRDNARPPPPGNALKTRKDGRQPRDQQDTDGRQKKADDHPSGAGRPAELRKQQRNRQQLVVAGETR